ncbi:MAG TPA: winged helix-turn-helix domain-containing protein [Terracidiphilus sp.]|nr:winged helix-turn-helix domain-containing protein [Terracidiphilus sp.]
MDTKPFVFRFADVEVREREFTLIKAGKVLAVEPKAFRVLVFLLRNPQRLVSKEELLNSVWSDVAVADGSLSRCIWLLRRLLEDGIREPRYIETVATVGYRWLCPVEVSEDVRIESESALESADTGDSAIPCKPRSPRRWWLVGLAVFAIGFVFAIWTLRRPLPPPRITAYTQLTHDGRLKATGGTDGVRVYFTQGEPQSPQSIAQVAVSGGDVAQIPVAVPAPSLVDVSPDGSSFLLTSIRGDPNPASLWNVRIPGGTIRGLGDAEAATFSPDGNSIAYSTKAGDIYIARSDGTEAHRLAHVGFPADFLAWSPDGRTLRFSGSEWDRLWEISSSGSGFHQMLPGWHVSEVQCCGRWTPDGTFFIFQSGPPVQAKNELWALDERRGVFLQPVKEPVQLTSGGIDWEGPVPGKDGKRIFATGLTSHGELFRFDAKTQQLQPFLGGISAVYVSFSHDGKSVAYVSYPDATLWKANRDGSDPVELSHQPIGALLPRWSPEDKRIVFANYLSPTVESYVVSSEGGTPQRLLPEDNEQQSDPNWSPDGSKITFGGFAGDDAKSVIRILDLGSRKVTTLPGSLGLWGARWSPDGRSIAAQAHGIPNLRIFDIKTQKWSVLADKGDVSFPAWSRDSQFLYYSRWTGRNFALFRIRVKGGKEELIADLKDWSTVFGWMGLDPSDAPLVLRDYSFVDIYALALGEK